MIRLFKDLKTYSWEIALVLFLMFLQTLSQLYLPTLMADIVDIGVVNGDTPYILKVGGWMLVIAALGSVCVIAASYWSAKVASGFGQRIRSKLFAHVEGFTLHEFDQIGTSSLITRTTNDITQVQQVMVMMLRMFIMAPLMCIGGIIMAVRMDGMLSLVFVVAIPALALAITLIAKKSVPLFKLMQQLLDTLNRVLREGLTGIRVIRAFSQAEHEKARFADANEELTQTAIKVNQLLASMWPLMMLVMNFSVIAIMWFGTLRIDSGHMQVGGLIAFIQYAMQIMFSLMMVTMMFVMIPRASASAVRINEVMDMKPTIPDMNAAARLSTDMPLPAEKGTIEFRDVTFRYPGAEVPALRAISFLARPGQVTAIIGGTGSGKSTLMNLLPRFYEIESGEILIGGVNIQHFSQARLRAMIGYVPQKSTLFTGSVAENIRFGRQDATDEEVEHAATIAQAHEFISELKDGYTSVITQGGGNLSGGQKQRLSIARALVRKPDIYIFDDSFSALDFKTDAKLRAALLSETVDATVLMIAQRVSTIMEADQIIVLDEGRVAGIGNHRSLLSTCEVYREIAVSQLSEEEIA